MRASLEVIQPERERLRTKARALERILLHSSSVLVQVSVHFIKPEVKPGKMAWLRVNAKTDSKVFLLGVDKSSRLMGTGNDITREQVSVHSAMSCLVG